MSERVTIERHKWPDIPHYEYDATLLGDDEWGSWFGAPAGNEVRRAGEVLFLTAHLSVYLLPIDEPWLVWFGDDPTFDFDVYVDVGTVPVRTPGRITMVDLDLDVIRRKTGEVVVLDEDELELHTATRPSSCSTPVTSPPSWSRCSPPASSRSSTSPLGGSRSPVSVRRCK